MRWKNQSNDWEENSGEWYKRIYSDFWRNYSLSFRFQWADQTKDCAMLKDYWFEWVLSLSRRSKLNNNNNKDY